LLTRSDGSRTALICENTVRRFPSVSTPCRLSCARIALRVFSADAHVPDPLKTAESVVDGPDMSDYFGASPSPERPESGEPSAPSQRHWPRRRLLLLVLVAILATALRLVDEQHLHNLGDLWTPPPAGGDSMPQNSPEAAKDLCQPPSFGYEDLEIRSETATQTSATTWHVKGTFAATLTSTGQRGRFGFRCDAEFPGNHYLPNSQLDSWPIPG
jgi:hypothetical protein